MPTSTCYIACGLIVSVVIGVHERQDPRPSSLQELFSRYQAAAYEQVRDDLSSIVTTQDQAQAAAKALSGEIDRWPVRPAAAFALEMAAVTESASSDQAYAILQVGERRLRSQPPSPWERDWQQAAVALLEGPISSRSARIVGPSADPSRLLALGIDPDLPTVRIGLGEFAQGGLRRFPDDQSIGLAAGLAGEQRVYAWARIGGAELGGGIPPAPAAQGRGYEIRVLPPKRSDAESAFRRVARGPDAELRALAHLHLGSLEMFDGDLTSALDNWTAALRESKRPSTQYLSLLLTARAQWTRGNPREALDSLKRALEIVPNAQSAIIMAAALGYLAGPTDNASHAVDDLLARPSVDADPWWFYFRGEFDQFDARLARVRAGIGQP